jgi:hypothetical protein
LARISSLGGAKGSPVFDFPHDTSNATDVSANPAMETDAKEGAAHRQGVRPQMTDQLDDEPTRPDSGIHLPRGGSLRISSIRFFLDGDGQPSVEVGEVGVQHNSAVDWLEIAFENLAEFRGHHTNFDLV